MTNREIDALVAERVMGCSVTRVGCCGCSGSPHTDDEGYPMAYSTDIAAAWEVVEKMGFRHIILEKFGGHWRCDIADIRAATASGSQGFGQGRADTAPMAICLAALKALGEIEKGAT